MDKKEKNQNVELQIAEIKSDRDLKLPKFGTDENGNFHIRPSNPKEIENLFKSFGCQDEKTGQFLLSQMLGTLDSKDLTVAVRASLPVLQSIDPQNELEGLLAMQMLGVHNMMMKIMRKTMAPGKSAEELNLSVNQAAKLARTFTAQLEALNRHRGKGQQKMTIEHVHVNDGGKAVIGKVDQGDKGSMNEK